MSNGAKKEYKFGTKNNWRRQMWNEIASRVSDRRDAVVLYLAGERALDLDVAEKKGFRGVNFIAVERDPSVVEKLRGGGHIVAHADLIDVLKAWPSGRRIDVVVGDFCCGLSVRLAHQLAFIVAAPQFSHTVFAMNFLRGRDASFNPWRTGIQAVVSTKHRGTLFYCYAFHAVMSTILRVLTRRAIGREPSGDDVAAFVATKGRSWLERVNKAIDEQAAICEMSYQSNAGSQVFDSIVLNCLCVGSVPVKFPAESAAKRSLAAALALQTMKQRRTGPYAERRAA